MIQATKTS